MTRKSRRELERTLDDLEDEEDPDHPERHRQTVAEARDRWERDDYEGTYRRVLDVYALAYADDPDTRGEAWATVMSVAWDLMMGDEPEIGDLNQLPVPTDAVEDALEAWGESAEFDVDRFTRS